MKGITTAFQAGNFPFQAGLFLLQPTTGPLLDGEGIDGLLKGLLAFRQPMDQLLPAVFQAGELLLNILFINTLLLLLLMQFLQPFRLLTQPFLQLLLFFELVINAAL